MSLKNFLVDNQRQTVLNCNGGKNFMDKIIMIGKKFKICIKFPLNYMILYFFSGFVLMMLKLPAERLKAANILAATIVDSENISSDLIPYIAMESHTNRDNILKCLTKATFK